ncbi:MAG: acetylglutamate kinase [Candidatus Poribacteria bacterium]|nr:acetylglutamate kinase [Candidatus Poribacteria bacterium]MDE0324711.1 acetylglutamate kinase [Candidatus Poribacteria bacterium]
MNRTAEVLIEALPYIRRFYDRRIVIKYGGAAMEDETLIHSVMEDIVLMKYVGIRPIIVHGGGPRITEWMDKVGKVPEFVQGLRVTDAETVEIAEMVLGSINKEIVARINQHGGKAIGLSGKDANLILAEKQETQVTDEDGHQIDIDLGYVGKIIGVNTESITTLDNADYIPVIAPIGVGVDGQTYNINADTMAGEIASAFQAEKLILLTDTRGILRDLSDTASLMSTIHIRKVDQLIDEGFIAGGMLPKVDACTTALMGGVYKTHIIDGRIPHSLLLEIFTEGGIGTEIVR